MGKNMLAVFSHISDIIINDQYNMFTAEPSTFTIKYTKVCFVEAVPKNSTFHSLSFN
jgi:hypothetical protein